MKEWCLKNPGYLVGIILIITWGIADIVSDITHNDSSIIKITNEK